MKKIVYLDNAATTPVDPAVLEEMRPYFSEQFANPMTYAHSSLGDTAHTAVEEARKERAEALVRVLDAQWAAVRSLLGPVGSPVLSGPEKVSVYVFNDPLRYIELVRSVENREVETGAQAHGNLSVPAPYLAAIDPLKGGAEPAASTKS